jgi:hypothetical protein
MSLINNDVQQQFMASVSISGGPEKHLIAMLTIDSPRNCNEMFLWSSRYGDASHELLLYIVVDQRHNISELIRVLLRILTDGSLESELLIHSFSIRDSRKQDSNKFRNIMSLINNDVLIERELG